MIADGTEWAGPGRIHVESFSEDGRLVATFDEVTLPHTKGIEPDLTLSNGRLETTLD